MLLVFQTCFCCMLSFRWIRKNSPHSHTRSHWVWTKRTAWIVPALGKRNLKTNVFLIGGDTYRARLLCEISAYCWVFRRAIDEKKNERRCSVWQQRLLWLWRNMICATLIVITMEVAIKHGNFVISFVIIYLFVIRGSDNMEVFHIRKSVCVACLNFETKYREFYQRPLVFSKRSCDEKFRKQTDASGWWMYVIWLIFSLVWRYVSIVFAIRYVDYEFRPDRHHPLNHISNKMTTFVFITFSMLESILLAQP